MRGLWKKELKLETHQIIEVPRGSIMRSVQLQGDDICLWFEFAWEDHNDLEKRAIQIIGTGHMELPDRGIEYIGTVLSREEVFVWHVYEVTEAYGSRDQG